MNEQRTAAELARIVADTLEQHGMPYAIGGAIALGFYAAPRATLDVDVNVFLPPATELHRVLAALGKAGFTPQESDELLRSRATTEGQIRGTIGELRVDVFLPAIAYYTELEARRRRAELLGRSVWILGPEDLAVLKLMFYRRKDLADVEAMLRDQGPAIDRDLIRRKLAELAGTGDERLAAFAAIERDVDIGE